MSKRTVHILLPTALALAVLAFAWVVGVDFTHRGGALGSVFIGAVGSAVVGYCMARVITA